MNEVLSTQQGHITSLMRQLEHENQLATKKLQIMKKKRGFRHHHPQTQSHHQPDTTTTPSFHVDTAASAQKQRGKHVPPPQIFAANHQRYESISISITITIGRTITNFVLSAMNPQTLGRLAAIAAAEKVLHEPKCNPIAPTPTAPPVLDQQQVYPHHRQYFAISIPIPAINIRLALLP